MLVWVTSVTFYFLAWKEDFRAVSLENKENKITVPSDQLWSRSDSNAEPLTPKHQRLRDNLELCVAEVMRTYSHC